MAHAAWLRFVKDAVDDGVADEAEDEGLSEARGCGDFGIAGCAFQGDGFGEFVVVDAAKGEDVGPLDWPDV